MCAGVRPGRVGKEWKRKTVNQPGWTLLCMCEPSARMHSRMNPCPSDTVAQEGRRMPPTLACGVVFGLAAFSSNL